MAWFHPDYLAYQRQRFTRPDPRGYWRAAARGFYRAGEKAQPGHADDRAPAATENKSTNAEMSAEDIAAEIADIRGVVRLLGELKVELAFREFFRKYRPDQLRDDLGRWAYEGRSPARDPSDTASQLAGLVIRICLAGSRSIFTDQWGNKSFWVTYDCIGGRSYTRSGIGDQIRGFITDPIQP